MPQQLNIRSDKAYSAAKRLAQRLGVSTTRVIEDALADMERRTIAPSDKVTACEADAFVDRISAMVRQANKDGKLNLTDLELYDENGLPK